MTEHIQDISRHRPRLPDEVVHDLLERHYNLRGSLTSLPSDRDANVAVRCDDRSRYVLKVAHALEDRTVLEAQHAAMERAAAHGLTVPRVVRTVDGRAVIEVQGSGGSVHLARVLTFLPGTPLGTANPRSLPLLADVGRWMGRLAVALSGFEHPAFDRELAWDMARAEDTVSNAIDHVTEEERRTIEPFVDAYTQVMARHRPALRRSVVHHDANDYNLLIEGVERRDRRVCGLIDFGDMVRSYTVADLAVATAYAVMGTDDPLRAASAVVTGYHEVHSLTEAEVAVLFPMTALRLCVSLCMSARQRRMEPENDYLAISREPALRLLKAFSRIHPTLAEYVFRRDAGYDPCPRGAEVAAWCRQSAASPVVRPASDRTPPPASDRTPPPASDRTAPLIFDFSTTSPEWTFEELSEPGAAAEKIDRRMKDARADVGIGRFGEVRLAYRGDQFAGPSQRRTVHLGVDLLQPAGRPVSAPLDGTVHSLADNDLPFDYGPTVVLEHRPADGPAFYTLYGHLSRSSLAQLDVGDAVRAGEAFAEIGSEVENGGWVPHVHFQIVADLLGHEGDFPGVAAPWMRDVWTAVSPSPTCLLDLPPEADAQTSADGDELLSERRRRLGPSLSVAYRDPIVVHRGHKAYLYDRDGQAYLDTVNNVAHVGHCHPRVVDAVSRQMAVLNTNTRYLYEHLTRYASRLTARLPEPLSVCYFVNSGSEANDLALRIARAHTRAGAVAVIDHAYHGHLSSLIDVSPYKFDGKGGSGRPGNVRVVPMPDPYRVPSAASEVLQAVRSAVEAGDVAAFVAEPAMGCGGQVYFPEGFLRAAFEVVREFGALCIADEVQTGFGRMGETFWAFELQDAVPDIVTMGKPIGNGHPLGAVVTSPEIAASFDTGMEYFNTFGGNPVSCAAGLAVLDVIEDERLQENAAAVGRHFRERLDELLGAHELIGDVRGSGLFLGVELVRDRASKEPAGEAAGYVVDRMREMGILSSRDGPHENVLKIKPPLVFRADEADRYVGALAEILREDFLRAQVR